MRAVGTLTVQDASSRLQHEYAAEIRPRLESRLGFRVVGKLVRRMVNQGDAVKAGQTLAQLDARDLVLGQEVARAALSNATAQLALSEAEFTRYRDLRDQGFISGLELERRQAALTAARAQAEPARAQAGVQNNQAGYAVRVADVSGVVTGVDAEPGAVLSTGSPVLRLAHDGPRDAVFSVPDDRAAALRALLGSPSRSSCKPGVKRKTCCPPLCARWRLRPTPAPALFWFGPMWVPPRCAWARPPACGSARRPWRG